MRREGGGGWREGPSLYCDARVKERGMHAYKLASSTCNRQRCYLSCLYTSIQLLLSRSLDIDLAYNVGDE